MFESLFRSVPVGVLTVDDGGAVARANKAAERMFKAPAGTLDGSSLDLLLPSMVARGPKTQRDPDTRGWLDALAEVECGLEARRTDGSWFPVSARAHDTPDGTRFVIVTDLSALDNARREFHESQKINKTGTWEFDLRRDVVRWSPELFRIFRLPVADEAPPYETHSGLFTPESWRRLEPAVAAASENGTPYELQLELSLTDEQGPLVAVARCEPQVDEEGEVVRLVGTFQDVTDLARAQRENQALLDRLEVAKRAAGLGIWEWNPSTDELTWDDRMHELYGVERRNLTYEDWRTAIHPDDRPRAERQLREVLVGHGSLSHEFRVMHPDGTLNILAAAAIATDARTGVQRMIGVNMDVTESALFQERLRQREAHLGLIMSALPDAVFTLHLPDQRIEFVNDQVEAILGYAPADLVGDTLCRIFPDAAAFDRVAQRLATSLEEGEVRFRTELVLRHQDGSDLHCELTVTQDPKTKDQVGAVATVRSIEERWQAQELLRRRQAQWDRFSAATSNLLWNWDLATNQVERNFGFQTALGYTSEEVDPSFEWWGERIHPEDRERVVAMVNRAIEDGSETTNYRYRFRLKDGRFGHFEDQLFIMRDETGRPYRVLGTMHDISEQARHEEEQRRVNNLESLGLLAGGIAHDFNNLLTSILAQAELVKITATQPELVTDRASQIGVAVRQAAQLTRQLLTFSKGGEPIRRSVSLEDLVREQVTFSLRGSSTKVHYGFETDLRSADVDRGQVGQVVQNLVLNAEQAMGKGGELHINARNVGPEEAGGAAFVELTIRDNGSGMPEAVRAKIFDPYFTTKSDGHGLGLSICHSIVERHGGTIHAESTPGTGTVFTILLPATSTKVAPASSHSRPAPAHGKILVVDDLEDVRASLACLLKAMGYQVADAPDVEAATRALRDAMDAGVPFDVVVTDLTIPGSEGGIDVVRQAKDLDPGLRVVVASGYAQDPVLANPGQYGFDGKLVKPIDAESLSDVLTGLPARPPT